MASLIMECPASFCPTVSHCPLSHNSSLLALPALFLAYFSNHCNPIFDPFPQNSTEMTFAGATSYLLLFTSSEHFLPLLLDVSVALTPLTTFCHLGLPSVILTIAVCFGSSFSANLLHTSVDIPSDFILLF